LNNSKGIKGKKGVLWWSIYRILQEKTNKPKYLLLENVDRLLKSPAKQKGRDFAIMLQSLNQLGYAVEWRVINAADYGMPQRRKRVFFIGYLNNTDIYNKIKESDKSSWLIDFSPIAKAFPIYPSKSLKQLELSDDIIDISENFNKVENSASFANTGLMINGNVFTLNTSALYEGQRVVLGDVIQKDEVPSEFFIDEKDINQWEYLKGTKSIERISKDGHKYKYSEGSMTYPDSLDKPSRTIITGEGGKAPSRFKHVISTSNGLRRLTPVELERLNMFPDNHTKLEGISDTKRAFFMGNALVTGIVEKLGEHLYQTISEYGNRL
jgi:DNA (cytosine-5)-methyltransferase 1